jgi:hypothetical protein
MVKNRWRQREQLLITADHGFIYQHRHLESSDFSGQDVSAETILIKDRRFVLGRNFGGRWA